MCICYSESACWERKQSKTIYRIYTGETRTVVGAGPQMTSRSWSVLWPFQEPSHESDRQRNELRVWCRAFSIRVFRRMCCGVCTKGSRGLPYRLLRRSCDFCHIESILILICHLFGSGISMIRGQSDGSSSTGKWGLFRGVWLESIQHTTWSRLRQGPCKFQGKQDRKSVV